MILSPTLFNAYDGEGGFLIVFQIVGIPPLFILPAFCSMPGDCFRGPHIAGQGVGDSRVPRGSLPPAAPPPAGRTGRASTSFPGPFAADRFAKGEPDPGIHG